MTGKIWRSLMTSVGAAAIVAAGTQAQAVVILGSNGSGGVNAYELVTTQLNYAGAIANANGTAFAGVPSLGVAGNATTAHLATFSNSKEYELIASRRLGAANNSFIGLSDDPAFAAGAFENGNNSGGALPANGAIAAPGQRGAGWANVTGTGLNTFHQRTPGTSIWGGAEPNNSGGENAAEMRDDGFLNDIPTSAARTSIIEWDLNLSESAIAGWKVQQIRGTNVNPSNANYKDLARNPSGPNVTSTETFHQAINFGSAGGDDQFAGGEAFPRGGGDNFLVRATGFIKVDSSGIYTINGAHDDAFFVSIDNSFGTAIVDEQNCCSSNPRQVFLTKGVHAVEVIFAEFGGGEHVEFGIGKGFLSNGSAGLALAGAAGHPDGIQIHQSADALGGLSGKALPQINPTGFTFQVQTSAGSPGLVGNIDNLAEAITLAQNGGAPEGSGVLQTINLGGGQFPGGGDQFVFYAKGFLDVLTPEGFLEAALHVNSDDGFRLLVNGEIVSQFDGPTGDSNTISSMLTLRDNDLIELFVFEQGGGEQARLHLDFDGLLGTTGDRFLLGAAGTPITVLQTQIIPEPASAALGLIGLGSLALRRRRVA